MSSSVVCILFTIAAYLLSVLFVGFYYARKNESATDFYLGGRQLGPLVTAMSAEASDMSSYLLMGLPGLAYLSGVADVGWTAIGLAIGTYLNWLFTAKRLRIYTHLTFHDDKHVLSTIAAVIIIIFFIPYTASGFAACGKLFHSLFGADYVMAMVLSAIVIVAYTAAGGFLAASITDFIQSIIMTFALLFVLVYATNMAGGGVDTVLANAQALPGYLSLTETFKVDTNSASPYTLFTIASTLAWGLGYFGMPHILLRFMAINEVEKLDLSRRVASIWVVVAMGVAVAIGIVGRSLSASGLVSTLTNANTETIIIQIANVISEHGLLMACVAGLVLSGILASTMSTADSQLLAASSSVSENILQEALNMNLNIDQRIRAARWTVVAIAILGMVIARDPASSVFKIVSFAWAGFGASFGPLVLASLFWKRATYRGALAGMVTGGATVFIWKFLIAPLGGVLGIYELLPAFLLSLLVLVVVSLLDEAPGQEIIAEFEKMKRKNG